MLRKTSLPSLLFDRGLNSLAEFMRKRAVQKHRFTHICVPMDDVIGMRLFSTGSFEQTQLDGVLDYLDENSPEKDAIFLDVGGNIGVYSILLRDYFSKIYTFEPNPITYDILKANIVLANVANAKPVNLALSNQSGEVPFYVPQNGNLGWATLNGDHHTVPVDRTTITCMQLDAFVADEGIDPRRIGLIKIDVEGHEKNVIDGAEKTLVNSGIPLLFEVLNDVSGMQLIAVLEKLGYRQFNVFRRSIKLPFTATVERKKLDLSQTAKSALVLAL
ncbi:FkbM family methyltransferase [uncultured Roseibium sp.]|uniref:FkbM family methyltransferase n=1 Tax=uncultured Roseibium sp. TaxID=1936171 RepID=UPI002610247B|nr:FkbM family methyltransferase [uncultured Roseibium sp.]